MDPEKKRLIQSSYIPLILILVIWLIKIFEVVFDFSLSHLGVFPRKEEGLIGIITSPFIHGDWKHLFSNTIPLFVLTTGVIYFYRKISFKVILLVILLTGMCVWLGGRPSYHIGASGVVYGTASFLFFSGIFRKNRQLLAVSLLTVFLYGGLIWGVLPTTENISWEGHLFGLVTGLALAIFYKNEKTYMDELEYDSDYSNVSSTLDIDIDYEIVDDE